MDHTSITPNMVFKFDGAENIDRSKSKIYGNEVFIKLIDWVATNRPDVEIKIPHAYLIDAQTDEYKNLQVHNVEFCSRGVYLGSMRSGYVRQRSGVYINLRDRDSVNTSVFDTALRHIKKNLTRVNNRLVYIDAISTATKAILTSTSTVESNLRRSVYNVMESLKAFAVSRLDEFEQMFGAEADVAAFVKAARESQVKAYRREMAELIEKGEYYQVHRVDDKQDLYMVRHPAGVLQETTWDGMPEMLQSYVGMLSMTEYTDKPIWIDGIGVRAGKDTFFINPAAEAV